MFWSYLIVFLLAATPMFEIMVIIPIAIMGGMNAFGVMFVSFLGNLLTVILFIFLADRFKEWFKKRQAPEGSNTNEELEEPIQENKRKQRAKRIWDKYGLPGLAFIGPFFVGSHVTALMAMAFGGTRQRVLFWMTASLLIWTLILGLAFYYGVDFFRPDIKQGGFIQEWLGQ